ncbi:putative sensor histidine kinase/response regulator TcsB/Sln1 [Aspergillus mulundensis]|uniref:histidine kinase n=1 Tax=Aspergillus mulundensis TaxID=1810919 RepID=A0A3D8S5E8_9EURO|nr:Two-component system protein B [Aspergillus mulundensis]RDW81509.1 Two-component system protein B [Aspergillus mulundensis]
MRVPIAVQLGLLVLLTALAGLAALAIATWINNYNFVVGVKSKSLELVATIKSSQIAGNLDLLETTCKTIITRILLQSTLESYYAGNTSNGLWDSSITDVQSALGTRGYLSLYQASVYARGVEDGETTARRLINVTSDDVPEIRLPYNHPNGTAVMLGDDGLGYPPSLYPNLTENATSNGVRAFGTVPVTMNQPLLLGPLATNDSFSLVSLSVPIINNTSAADILGYITVVASAANLQDVVKSRQGLGDTGQVLLLSPSRPENRFPTGSRPGTPTSDPQISGLDEQQVHYVFAPTPLPGNKRRHSVAVANGESFPLRDYPIALNVLSKPYASINHSITNLSSRNENDSHVAVGAIQQRSDLVEWVLIIEETHAEAFAPVSRLRNIILACVFGVAGVIALLIPPLAHISVAPIRRLREATRKSVNPTIGPLSPSPSTMIDPIEVAMQNDNEKSGFFSRLRRGRSDSANDRHRDHESHQFQIPSRVKERKHLIMDELTDLTSTFNEMSDELVIQYNRLEERVAERTRELEKAKIAAETANESKTLFIANISHELKTPLNGILGMCAVCMGEDDLPRIKKSLHTVYKSGDLLLHLLNDLLTFSRNQIDQAIRLEEKEFKLSDIRSQLNIIFQNQVQEKQISFSIKFCHPDTPRLSDSAKAASRTAGAVYGPPGTARLKDMVLWGDQHRILQILINLVSNSLKFTPEEGIVAIRIKCLGEEHTRPNSPRPESKALSRWRSRGSSHASSRPRPSIDLPKDGGDDNQARPSNMRTLILQFEVEDTGPGIPHHLQNRVFEPFVQGDLRLNRKYGGTGLGLSICMQLARLMRGQILLDSEQGRGTLFSVRIPLGFVKESAPSTSSSMTSVAPSRTSSVFSLNDLATVAKAPSNHSVASQHESTQSSEKQDSQPRLVGLSQPFFAPAVRPAEDDGPRKIRALVAEDNVVNQEVVTRMLALEDVYDVIVVKDGQEAYDTVKANMEEGRVFDLIFMDIQMPNLDGIESTRLIRQMGYSAPIVALSAFSEDSNIKDCMNSGMDMFIRYVSPRKL